MILKSWCERNSKWLAFIFEPEIESFDLYQDVWFGEQRISGFAKMYGQYFAEIILGLIQVSIQQDSF